MSGKTETLQFADYRPGQPETLRAAVQAPEWRALLSRRAAMEDWKADVIAAPTAPAQQAMANEYLTRRNGERVRGLMDEGETDEDVLAAALGDWRTALAGDDAFPIGFLGLSLTMDCTFMPRCLYCNQLWLPRRLRLDDWKRLLTEAAEPIPPYVYLTGGEPLIMGSEVWGDDGLVAFATRLGCAVNINTNAVLITPQVALQLVKVGLARLHVSLDSADPRTQDQLFGGAGRMQAVMAGVHNVQIAREVLGADHPQIHFNCVLTARNLFQLPDLLRFILEMRLGPAADPDGKADKDDPRLRGELAFHLIPVGGGENALLRPAADEWKRFYTETWARADEVWQDYQAAVGLAAADRKPLAAVQPFANPFLRVDHGMDLDEYCRHAALGQYWEGALAQRCYVAPTQAFVLPDGSQHWCGAHAICRPPPLGSVTDAGIRENIRSNISRLAECPDASCAGCAGATCVINQATDHSLRDQVRQWLGQRGPA